MHREIITDTITQGCQVCQMKIRETFWKVSKFEYSMGISVSKMIAFVLYTISYLTHETQSNLLSK